MQRMQPLATNPESGYHYIHVISNTWGSFVDVFSCYDYVSRKLPWVSVIMPESAVEHPRWQDPDACFVYWENWESVPDERRAASVIIYSEALDDDLETMLPAHRDHLDRMVNRMRSFDMILAHTPEMAERLHQITKRPTGVMPVGWEPAAMGGPRRTTKLHRLVYHGSPAGRRKLIMPYLLSALDDKERSLFDASGQFGRGLLSTLDTGLGSLYIAHSRVRSWSTWRIWQALAAGCAIVGEPGDCWPLPPELLITIDPVTLENIEQVTEQIRKIAQQDDRLLQCGSEIYNLLGERFTTTECHHQYLVPETKKLRTS